MTITANPFISPAETAALIVDGQADFISGSLAVPDGAAVIAGSVAAGEYAGLLVLSEDFHPPTHMSFIANGGIWPDHCVQGTPGVALDPQLLALARRHPNAITISKGTDAAVEAYSPFDGHNRVSGLPLLKELRQRGIYRILVTGLATDYCVRAAVLDALRAGFEVIVLTDAVRAVNVNAGDGERALAEMRDAGALLVADLDELAAVDAAGRRPIAAV